MDYIYHITLQSGDIRKSPRSEIETDFLQCYVNKVYENSIDKPVRFKIRDNNFFVSSSAWEDGYLISLYGEILGEKIPLLTSGVSLNNYNIWDIMHNPEEIYLPIKTKKEDKPPLPYLADRLEIGIAYFLEDLTWTADFSRNMAWAALEGYSPAIRSTKKRRFK